MRENVGSGRMSGVAPLAREGTAAGRTEDIRGEDIPTTVMDPTGTGATAVSGGMLAISPIPNVGILEIENVVVS